MSCWGIYNIKASSEELKTILDMNARGALSNIQTGREMKRRALLEEDYDPEVDAVLVSQEMVDE